MEPPPIRAVFTIHELHKGPWDGIVVVAPPPLLTGIALLDKVITQIRTLDNKVDADVVLVPAADVAGGRIVLASTGPLHREFDDVRRFGDAARAAMLRAVAAGIRRPVFVVRGRPEGGGFVRAQEVALLEALGALWRPMETPGLHSGGGIEVIGWFVEGVRYAEAYLGQLHALESCRSIARDITSASPEYMSPARISKLCVELFENTSVVVDVVDDPYVLSRQYPLLTAVARASGAVERHRPAVVRFTYQPHESAEHTLFLAGKGVVYDTGAVDLKYGGAMAGMSRDKGGAGVVVALLAAAERMKCSNLKIVAEIGLVRNSIGPDSYVSDEIVIGHSGVRVRIVNTDAEGRLVLADLLSHLREAAVKVSKPRFVSVATLTGHAIRAYGSYAVAIDNGPARKIGIAESISKVGDLWGEPFEVSRLRREDWEFIRPRSSAEDVCSCNHLPSSATPRGHQFPMAFLMVASGLDKHGYESNQPMPFTHLDISGAIADRGDWQHGRVTGAPVTALSAALLGFG